MRIVVAVLVLALSAAPAVAQSPRERAMRVLDVVDELKLDDAMMNKLLPAYSAYEKERDTLLAKQVDLLEQLRIVSGDRANSNIADKLLDDHLALQRALVAAEAKFVAKLRKLALQDGLRPLRVAGAMKVAEGVTTVQEVLGSTPLWE